MKLRILIPILTVIILIVCFLGYRVFMENNKVKIKENEDKKYEETLELVKDINQNSDFGGLELLEFSYHAKEDQQSQGASDILPYFSEEVKDGIEGIYFMYPYDSKEYRLANISITQIPYHIFGITVGHNFNEATKVIEKKDLLSMKQIQMMMLISFCIEITM